MTSTAQPPAVSNRVAHEVAAALKSNRVPYIFGIPGGGTSIDLIEACQREGIPFVLTQHETTAAMMALVCGELTGTCGVCVSIMGPGATNLASGAVYAYLERHPLLCVTERYSAAQAPTTSMQKIDHPQFFGPVCKASFTLDANGPGRMIADAIRIAEAERPGPVHVDFPQDLDSAARVGSPDVGPGVSAAPSRMEGDPEAIASAIDSAERPILVAGPVVLRQGAADNLLSLAEKLQAAVMVTSKARGVIPEDHRLYAGVMSGVYAPKTLETRLIDRSDLVVAVGLDRVELLSPWKHGQQLVTLDAIRVEPDETVGEPTHAATGFLPDLLDAVTDGVRRRATWDASEIEAFWSQAMHELGAADAGLNATNALVTARRMAPRDAILASEAGVYGRISLYAWKVFDPATYFDSSGANTMGFSVPAGLAASLVKTGQKAISLVGDAGLLMRAGELEVAARLKLAPVIVVFDDTTLGMIRVKQRSKGYAREGVDLAQTDFVRLAESFGGVGAEVRTLDEFEAAFARALESDRLHLIDVRVDPDVYAGHVRPIRGI